MKPTKRISAQEAMAIARAVGWVPMTATMMRRRWLSVQFKKSWEEEAGILMANLAALGFIVTPAPKRERRDPVWGTTTRKKLGIARGMLYDVRQFATPDIRNLIDQALKESADPELPTPKPKPRGRKKG